MLICAYTDDGETMPGARNCEWNVRMAEVFRALGDANRLSIIGILASETHDQLCVGDLATLLGINQPALSQHLRTLKSAGLVVAVKKGQCTFYRFNREAIIEYKRSVDEMFEQVLKKC
jgi:ArsR family transcriptional regulator